MQLASGLNCFFFNFWEQYFTWWWSSTVWIQHCTGFSAPMGEAMC